MKGKSLSRVRLLATPWTATHQAPPSMGFSKQEYWNGVPLPSPDQGATFLIYKRVYFCIITGWVSKAHVPLFFTLLCGLLGSDAAPGDMRAMLVFSTKPTVIYE